MRCKAGRTRGPADEDFELSRFYHLKRGAGGGDGSGEEEKGWRMENGEHSTGVHCRLLPFFPCLSSKARFTFWGPHRDRNISDFNIKPDMTFVFSSVCL